jgi:hypothetical protein
VFDFPWLSCPWLWDLWCKNTGLEVGEEFLRQERAHRWEASEFLDIRIEDLPKTRPTKDLTLRNSYYTARLRLL